MLEAAARSYIHANGIRSNGDRRGRQLERPRARILWNRSGAFWHGRSPRIVAFRQRSSAKHRYPSAIPVSGHANLHVDLRIRS